MNTTMEKRREAHCQPTRFNQQAALNAHRLSWALPGLVLPHQLDHNTWTGPEQARARATFLRFSQLGIKKARGVCLRTASQLLIRPGEEGTTTESAPKARDVACVEPTTDPIPARNKAAKQWPRTRIRKRSVSTRVTLTTTGTEPLHCATLSIKCLHETCDGPDTLTQWVSMRATIRLAEICEVVRMTGHRTSVASFENPPHAPPDAQTFLPRL